MFSSPFSTKKEILVHQETEVIFVSDMFIEQYVGGAELTSEALIEASPFKIQKINSKDVTLKTLESGFNKHWIFGNFSAMDFNLIPSIVANLEYTVLEYDYKYCKYRSPEKHEYAENSPCDCHTNEYGKMLSTFFYGAQNLWFMSEAQQSIYLKKFPFLKEIKNNVLSSVFNEGFFAKIHELREKNKDVERKGWIVLGSESWIKGAEDAKAWCQENEKDYTVVWGLAYDELLEKLSTAEGFVYLPRGGDTCPRMVIEAKLLGCKLELNNNVQHATEEWFATDDILLTESYLYACRNLFWSAVKASMNWKPTISGYTTTKDCIDQGYPWEQCIQSMLGFADEVVVVDGGSKDGTWEKLLEWSENEPKLKVDQVLRDWTDKRHAVFDGLQKAEARKRCTSDFLWQQDADEVVHEEDYEKISKLCKNFPNATYLICLPVIEYWGSTEKVRCDITPWKWRLSKNFTEITHGIPSNLRSYDGDGELYALQGTDGCDYIHSENFQLIPHANFYTPEVDNARRAALSGDNNALEAYSNWFNSAIQQLPSVHHYSWINIPRKIRTYRDYWSKHWLSLYDIDQTDTAENNMFFDKPWSEVSEKEIENLATELADKLGGWIFHSKVDLNKKVPHVVVSREQPKIMLKND